MVTCAVFGCNNRTDRRKDDAPKLSFFKVPRVIHDKNDALKFLSQRRFNLWFLRVNRKDVTAEKFSGLFVCSQHFVSGRPAKDYDESNPDYAPSLNLGYKRRTDTTTKAISSKRAYEHSASKSNMTGRKKPVTKHKVLKNSESNDDYYKLRHAATQTTNDTEEDDDFSFENIELETSFEKNFLESELTEDNSNDTDSDSHCEMPTIHKICAIMDYSSFE